MPEKKIYEAKVVSNQQIADGIMKMTLSAPGVAGAARPGQFANLYPAADRLILPRPVSICDADPDDGTVTFVYAVVGAGTAEFAACRSGDLVRVSSPLGNGFTLPRPQGAQGTADPMAVPETESAICKPTATEQTKIAAFASNITSETESAVRKSTATEQTKIAAFTSSAAPETQSAAHKSATMEQTKTADFASNAAPETESAAHKSAAAEQTKTAALISGAKTPLHAVLIGGGVGAAPMYFLAKELLKLGVRCTVVAGFRKEPFLTDDLKALGARVIITTELPTVDAFLGTVIDGLEASDVRGNFYFACGPRPMLKAVNTYVQKLGGDIQVSLEERMGCGYGACVGCVCKIRAVLESSAEADASELSDGDGKKIFADYEHEPAPVFVENGEFIVRRKVCKDGPVFMGSEVIWE